MRNRPLFLVIALVAVVAVSACLLTGCGSIVLSGGLSAYEIAVQNGFVGTEAEWLESLKGADAGRSAYDLAVENGFKGTMEEWLASLKGDNGKDGEDGKDATSPTIEEIYQAAVKNGFEGSFLDFIKEYLSVDSVGSDKIASEAILSSVSVYCSFKKTVTVNSGWGWNEESEQRTEEYGSAGSGVIFWLNKEEGDAYVITNYHVVYSAESNNKTHISEDIYLLLYGHEIALEDESGTAYLPYKIPATYVGGAMTYDIAVLRVENSEVLKNSEARAVRLADSNKIVVGQDAIAIGNPEAGGVSVTKGIISVDSEIIKMTGADEVTPVEFRVMRIDTAVNQGNSGGGLFDGEGNLIGIVNAKIIYSNVENIAYAIPSNIAAYVAQNIIDGYEAKGTAQKVQKYLLGIMVHAAGSAAVYDADEGVTRIREEVRVLEVTAGSIVTGILEEGDLLVSIQVGANAPVAINRTFAVVDAMLNARSGDTVVITYLREGVQGTATFTVSTPSEVQ